MQRSRLKRAHFLIRGSVQGVGFRYSTKHRATGIGVTGYVRNLVDGRVECLAEGTPEQIEMLELFLNKGPSFSQVVEVKKTITAINVRKYKEFCIT